MVLRHAGSNFELFVLSVGPGPRLHFFALLFSLLIGAWLSAIVGALCVCALCVDQAGSIWENLECPWTDGCIGLMYGARSMTLWCFEIISEGGQPSRHLSWWADVRNRPTPSRCLKFFAPVLMSSGSNSRISLVHYSYLSEMNFNRSLIWTY